MYNQLAGSHTTVCDYSKYRFYQNIWPIYVDIKEIIVWNRLSCCEEERLWKGFQKNGVLHDVS